MSEDRKIAICIGVGQAGKPRRLPYLAGAINGAREFDTWANKFGYSSKLITDDTVPVTLVRLRKELEDALSDKRPIYRMILYFAGHGFIREVEKGLWLLSDWDDELRAVAVEGLRRRLLMYDIKQISIFADACRSIPPDVQALELAEDPVLGRGPAPRAPTPPSTSSLPLRMAAKLRWSPETHRQKIDASSPACFSKACGVRERRHFREFYQR